MEIKTDETEKMEVNQTIDRLREIYIRSKITPESADKDIEIWESKGFKDGQKEIKARDNVIIDEFLNEEELLFSHGNPVVKIAFDKLIVNGEQSEDDFALFCHISQLLDEPRDLPQILDTLEFASTKKLSFIKEKLAFKKDSVQTITGSSGEGADDPNYHTDQLVQSVMRNVIKIHRNQGEAPRLLDMQQITVRLIKMVEMYKKEYEANGMNYFNDPTMVNLTTSVAITGTDKAKEFIKEHLFVGSVYDEAYGNMIERIINDPKNADREFCERQRTIFIFNGRNHLDFDTQEWIQN